jgi:hypothetical protein
MPKMFEQSYENISPEIAFSDRSHTIVFVMPNQNAMRASFG